MKGFALEPVPLKYRKGAYAITSVWWGWIWFIGGPIYGVLDTAGWPFWTAVLLLFAANWILAFVNMAIGLIGSRQGTTVANTSRYAFGNIGTYIPSVIYFITLAGWFGVSVGILAGVMGTDIGYLPIWAWALVMGVIMAALAIIGMWLITWLANWAVPVMFVLMMVGTGLAVTQSAGGIGAVFSGTVPGAQVSIPLSIGLTVAFWIVGASLAPDIARWAKGDNVVKVSSLSAFGISNPFIMILGLISAIAIGNSNLFEAMPNFGSGTWWGPIWFWLAIIAIMLIVWTSGDCQLYTSGLSLSNMIRKPAHISTTIAAVLGVGLAVAGIENNMLGWLTILGYFVPAITGILIADYFFVHRSRYPHPKDIKKWINPVAIVTYAICVFVEWYLQVYMNDLGVPVLNSLILSIVLYTVLMKVTGWLNWDKSAAEFRSYPPGWPKVPAEKET